jgi:NAD(P)-dependent dehydrogenase (short-subunit alcohol dehydrogenase family)
MYAVSKHGVVGAVRSFAKPLQEEGIRINAVCPNCIGMLISHLSVWEAETDETV